jgi:hypothetical protein
VEISNLRVVNVSDSSDVWLDITAAGLRGIPSLPAMSKTINIGPTFSASIVELLGDFSLKTVWSVSLSTVLASRQWINVTVQQSFAMVGSFPACTIIINSSVDRVNLRQTPQLVEAGATAVIRTLTATIRVDDMRFQGVQVEANVVSISGNHGSVTAVVRDTVEPTALAFGAVVLDRVALITHRGRTRVSCTTLLPTDSIVAVLDDLPADTGIPFFSISAAPGPNTTFIVDGGAFNSTSGLSFYAPSPDAALTAAFCMSNFRYTRPSSPASVTFCSIGVPLAIDNVTVESAKLGAGSYFPSTTVIERSSLVAVDRWNVRSSYPGRIEIVDAVTSPFEFDSVAMPLIGGFSDFRLIACNVTPSSVTALMTSNVRSSLRFNASWVAINPAPCYQFAFSRNATRLRDRCDAGRRRARSILDESWAVVNRPTRTDTASHRPGP